MDGKEKSRRVSSVKKSRMLERFKEEDTDIESSFLQDSVGSADAFDVKIKDWKPRKYSQNDLILSLLYKEDKAASKLTRAKSLRHSSYKENIENQSPRSHKRLSSAELIDTVLQKYEIKERLGKGAFAEVFRATNRSTKKDIAVKQIHLNSQDNIIDLMSEINLLKALKHPNIVKYHGFVHKKDCLDIFLEYCDKGSLRDLYKSRKKINSLPVILEKEIAKYIQQVLTGLEYLHQRGVVHRDIKAANILLTSEGIVKLADFGVSTKINISTVNLKQCTVVGTPNWMAPEVISLDGVSTSSDIWSVGATIIELYTGYPPYHNLNSMAALHAIVSEEYPSIPETLSNLAVDFLMKCFQKNPDLRSSAAELSRHPWLNELQETLPSIRKTSSGDHLPRRIRNSSQGFDKIRLPKSSSRNTSNGSGLPRRISTRNTSHSSSMSTLSKFIETDYESVNWHKDFDNLGISELKIDTQYLSKSASNFTLKKHNTQE